MKFIENRPVGLFHNIREDRQAAPVRHPDDDFVNTKLTTTLDNLFHCRDQAFAAIEAKSLGAHVFDMQEFLKTFGLNK